MTYNINKEFQETEPEKARSLKEYIEWLNEGMMAFPPFKTEVKHIDNAGNPVVGNVSLEHITTDGKYIVTHLTLDGFQKLARTTANYPKQFALTYCTLALAGEAGEISNKVKKIYRDDNGVLTDERREAIIDELGDVFWYVAAMADSLDINLDEVAKRNLEKLRRRTKNNTIHGSGDNR